MSQVCKQVYKRQKRHNISKNVVKLSPNVAKKVTSPSQRHIHTYEYFLLHVFWTLHCLWICGLCAAGKRLHTFHYTIHSPFQGYGYDKSSGWVALISLHCPSLQLTSHMFLVLVQLPGLVRFLLPEADRDSNSNLLFERQWHNHCSLWTCIHAYIP